MLYAASGDMHITEDEKELIISKLVGNDFLSIRNELERDNDYKRIQKILFNLEKFNCSKEECESMLKDMKDVFMADGKFDSMERSMFLAIKKLF